MLDEDATCHPLTDYGRSKMEAEAVVRAYIGQLPLTIVRPPSVYGPRDTDVLNVFKNIKMRVNLQVGSVDQLVSLVYVEDLANGIIQAAFAENTTGKTYFLCEDRPYRWSQFAPARGATLIPAGPPASRLFQSTPPRGGRHQGLVPARPGGRFQSTPPRGGRLLALPDNILEAWFQSTPPRGGRLPVAL